MTHAARVYATLDDWIAHEVIPFSLDSRPDFNAAVDQVIDSLGGSGALLGFGEALHGGEELFVLRNHLFQRLFVGIDPFLRRERAAARCE